MMNKKLKLVAAAMISLVLFSCNKDDHMNPSEEGSLTLEKQLELMSMELGKIESSYYETSKLSNNGKVETTNSYNQDESIAPIEYKNLIKKIADQESQNLSNTLKSTEFMEYVGVIKHGTCGSYPVLEIHMDCENSSPNNSKIGDIGDIILDGDITLKFCIVPVSYFHASPHMNYSVLQLDTYVGGVNPIAGFCEATLTRHFDNSDGNNSNWVKFNGSLVSAANSWGWKDLTIGSIYYGFIVQTTNTRLGLKLIYQDKTRTTGAVDNLGIAYGLFGRSSGHGWEIGSGSVWINDENTNNANWLYIDKDELDCWPYKTTWQCTSYLSDLNEAIIGGENTTMKFHFYD